MQGEPLFHVKWEGYDKKSDMTWEPEDNLKCEPPLNRATSANPLTVFFLAERTHPKFSKSISGRSAAGQDYSKRPRRRSRAKRGRPGSSTPTTNGKRAKKNGHPLGEGATTYRPPRAVETAGRPVGRPHCPAGCVRGRGYRQAHGLLDLEERP